jgi:hypothetical protein
VRDEQVRRYARHILLPDVGGLGQTALMVSTARLELRESEPAAELLAATYLAAGGVGGIVLRGASDAQTAGVATHGPDTRLLTAGEGRDVTLAATPPWWPGADGDATALAFWRGAIAAVRWMSDIANR